MVHLGQTIKAARDRCGWSQGHLAQQASVSRPTVARIEAGADVSTTTLTKVAQVLNLSLELRHRE